MAANEGYWEIMRAVLGDGEWHPFGECLAALEPLIPPEDAVRVLRWPEEAKAGMPVDELLRTGREQLVSSTLSDMYAERSGPKGVRMAQRFRIRPDKQHHGKVSSGTQDAICALLAIPGVRTAISKARNLNPAQQFWLGVVKSHAAPQPFEEDGNGKDR